MENDSTDLLKQQRIIMSEQLSSEALAAYVVSYRALGIDRWFAIHCMQLLAKRRSLGDTFNYEQWIDDKLKTISVVPESSTKTSSVFDLDKIKNTVSKYVNSTNNTHSSKNTG